MGQNRVKALLWMQRAKVAHGERLARQIAMGSITRVLLFSTIFCALGAETLLAQRGHAIGATAPLPSSTAIGAGALSTHPSATSRSTLPSIGRPGFGAIYSGTRGSARNNNRNRREWRTLPREYFAAPFYYPFYDYGGDYSSAPAPGYDDSSSYGPDPATDAMLRNQAALGQQVQRLTAQMNDLMYGQQQQPGAMAPEPVGPPPVPLTIVLRDGKQLSVQNYAITGNTLWDFTRTGAARKIPLSNIDLAASAKATQANGGEFPQVEQ
jgi:hypothetical protein